MKPTLALALAAVATLGGCAVKDADLAEGALASFTLTPAATTTDRFTMDLSGTVTANYMAPEPATLVVKVDGQPVVQQAIDLSKALTQPVMITVPLAAAGPNQISAEVDYQGATLSADAVVTAAMTPPTITPPTFTQTYTAHVGLAATGAAQVTAATGYTVDAVATSVDGGPWVPATANGASWDITLVNPDIGPVDVAIKATVSIDGHSADAIVHQGLTIAPVFDCNDSTNSMLPSSTLLLSGFNGQVGGENRIMVGYFGSPSGGHDVTFVLSGHASAFQGNPLVSVASQTNQYGTTEQHVVFNTNVLRCDTGGGNQCDTPYNLTAWVDGVQLCTTTANGGTFGNVHRYN